MKYETIPLMPRVIAEIVCGREYTGEEWSAKVRNSYDVKEIEALRKGMTPEQIKGFQDYCDDRCRRAFEVKAEWFMKLLRAGHNLGRDQLYTWTSHWLGAYLRRIQRKRWLEADQKAGLGKERQT